MHKRWFLLIFSMTLLLGLPISAQSELAATLEVLNPVVQVLRVNTANPIEVNFEAIVGVGDTITTGEEGRARVTFFADGTTTELEPNTTYVIEEFNGDEESFTIRVSVLAGQTRQQLGRILDANSSYRVDTPGMTLAARGTIFDIRVEVDGRAAMLVRESSVEATSDGVAADVPSEFGVRSEPDAALSDVVRASSFDELDSALDGCSLAVTTPDDVALNVRLAPSADSPRIGFVDANTIDIVYGTNEGGGWYRIPFADGFGWILASEGQIVNACAGLRVFEDRYAEAPDQYNPDAPELPFIAPDGSYTPPASPVDGAETDVDSESDADSDADSDS